MPDLFQAGADSVSAPARRAVLVAPHDSNPLTEIPKGLFVGTAGALTLRGVDGTVDTLFKSVPAGTILPFRAQFMRATGTTAADILAPY